MSANSEDVRSSLIALFVAAQRRIAEHMRDSGLPDTAPARVMRIEPNEPNGWTYGEIDIRQNSLKDRRIEIAGAPWLSQTELLQVSHCAQAIATWPVSNLPFWTMFGGTQSSSLADDVSVIRESPGVIDYRDDPEEWVTRTVILPALGHHLRELPRMGAAGKDAAADFADEVLAAVSADHWTYLVTTPLGGIAIAETEDSLTQDGFTLRRMSTEEQAEWLQQRGGPIVTFQASQPLPVTVLELQDRAPRDRQPGTDPRLLASAIAAFQLHGFDLIGDRAAERQLPSWAASFGPTGPQLALRTKGNPFPHRTVTAKEFTDVVRDAALLRELNFATPGSARELSIHRVTLGASRDNPVDALIDFTIALEALLLPHGRSARHGDLSFRFRFHGAHYLAATPHERGLIAEDLGKLYNTRSRLVHGGKFPSPADIQSALNSADNYARKGVLRAVREGFPTAEDFADMLLS